MDIQHLKKTAADRLRTASYSPGRLALIYTGAAVALSLLITLVNFLLTRQMDTTAGLAGIGTRSVLSSVRMLLIIGGSAVMPFWEFGFLRTTLCISREEPAQPGTLLEGFRRFGVVLRLTLLRGLLCILIAFLCLQAATMLFMMSPMSLSFMESAQELIESGAVIDDAAMNGLLPQLTMVYVLWAVLACVVLIPLLYRFRLADWAVMDRTPGALAALRLSSLCTRRQRLKLFRLDLSFWWYYALQLLAAVLAYGDVALTAFGVTLDADAAFFGFYLLSLVVQLLTAWRFAPQVQTTYACAYNTLLDRSGLAKAEH